MRFFGLLLVFVFAMVSPGAAEPAKWQEGPGYRYIQLPAFNATNAGFSSMTTTETGIHFTNTLSEKSVAQNRVTENGSGVALGDVDGDGWCDIYFCGLENHNILYRNLGGWKFADITADSGAACDKQFSTGAILADLDGDGDLDLLVNSIGGGTREFLNDGKAHFTEVKEGRLVKRFAGTSMALGDVDRDGDLDLYVTNYRTLVQLDEVPQPHPAVQMVNGKIVVTPANRFAAIGLRAEGVETVELGERDYFYLNNGKGLFSPVSWTNGNFLWETGEPLTTTPLDWGLSVMIRDLNGDLLPDIFTCNDFFFSPDRMWLQQPGTKFQLPTREALPKISLASMALDVADINRDGYDDILVVEMLGRDYSFRQTHFDNETKADLNGLVRDPHFRPELPRNTLFLNRGNGTYAEIAEYAGLDATEWSWGALFLDVDLDGFEDLIIPTGNNHDVQNADVLRGVRQSRQRDSLESRMGNLAKFGSLESPVLAYRNQHSLKFKSQGEDWGFHERGRASGAALADLDNDGALDLVVNRLNAPVLLYRNDSKSPRIGVRLAGLSGNSHGIGARIKVFGGPVIQTQEMISGGRYLSCDDSMRVFAAGTAPLNCEITWPTGKKSTFTNLPPNRVYTFVEQGSGPNSVKSLPTVPFFKDVSALLSDRHLDAAFDDYARQPLLPYSLSTQGPGMACYDFNGDGLDDLVHGGGRNGHMRMLQNSANGAFTNSPSALTSGVAAEDQLGILLAKIFQGRTQLVVARANYETMDSQLPSVQIFENGTNLFSLDGATETVGCLALSDYDHDGDLDLFVGGRVMPGRYPTPCNSRLFRNDGDKFVLDSENTKKLVSLGMVTSAAFADLNSDGLPDLLLAIEGASPRLFINHNGTFEDKTKDFNLELFNGLWNSVVTGDFDNDGKTDFAMGNWGENNKYARNAENPAQHPFKIYFADFDGNGTTDILESFYNSALHKEVPFLSLDQLSRALPFVAERFKTYTAFSQAGVAEVSGDSFSRSRVLQVNEFSSSIFLNRGDHFERRPLPAEAQFAPVFGMAVADLDNDGNEDLLLAQNLFDLPWRTGPQDSGTGLWLRGNGKGDFNAVSLSQSGIAAYGQQRSLVVSDFNHDGRVDFALAQNNGETKLFENVLAPSGLRIRFAGPDKNRDAVGTRYRVTTNGKAGSMRQVQCGSGWLSQQSFIQVIPKPVNESRIAVFWPNGKATGHELPLDAMFIEISEAGIKKIN
jgi:hypothetical protein